MIYDDFREAGWPRPGWVEHRYPHEDIWDPAAAVECPGPSDPRLTIDLPRFTRSHSNHVKAMAMTDRLFDLSQGPGFRVNAEISVEIFGARGNPLGLDPGDPRLAAGALVTIDPSTGMVLDFFIGADRIAPLYERLPMARAALGDYPAYSRLLEPAPRREGDWRVYDIQYDRQADVAEWRVDGDLVARRDKIGAPIGRDGPIVKWNRFRVGCGLFTLLDNLPDDQVRADDHPKIPGFIPNNFHDRFGQGGRVSMRALTIET